MSEELLDLSKEIGSLIKGTNAHLVTNTTVMHSRQKVETPLMALNCILGGGVPLGCMVEAYGEPTAGKSSMWYQTLGNFQKQYPEGIGIIVDTEASVDGTRMPFMGVDPSKVLRIPASTLEWGFKQVFTILDKKGKNEKLKNLPVFILWDTIGINPTDKQFETKEQYAEGMLGKAKLIKHYLSIMLPYIDAQPVLVVLLNQVTTEMHKWGSRLSSGGGWGIKHNAHLRLCYNSGNTDYDNVFATYKYGTVNIEKSKLSPLFGNLDIVIDITQGGCVHEVYSMFEYAKNRLGYIHSDSWCNMDALADRYPEYRDKFDKFLNYKNFRRNELADYIVQRPKLMRVLQLAFLDDIMQRYSYQAEVCKEYREKVLEYINAPEPMQMQDGSIVDMWTGEVMEPAPTIEINSQETQEVQNEEIQENQEPQSNESLIESIVNQEENQDNDGQE